MCRRMVLATIALIFTPQIVLAQCQATVSQFELPDHTFPYDAAFTPDGSRVLIVNRDAASVVVLDTERLEMSLPIPVGIQPLDIEVSDNGRWAVVANSGSGTISILDLVNNLSVRTVALSGGEPYRLKLTPDSQRAVIGITDPGVASRIAVVDLMTGREIRSFPTNAHGMTRLRFYDGADPQHGRSGYHYSDFVVHGNRVIIPWFARLNGYGGQPDYSLVSIYDLTTGEHLNSITTPPYPAGLALSPGGNQLVLSHSDSFVRQVSVVDLSLLITTRVISTPDQMLGWQVQLSADGREAFVQAQSRIVRVNVENSGYSLLGSGGGDTEFAKSRDDRFLFSGGFYPSLYRLEDQTVLQYFSTATGYDLALARSGDVVLALGNQPTHQNNAVYLIDYSALRADSNHDGMINSQDFFSFLADYFAGAADLDGDGVTTSTDFFQYLRAVERCRS